MVMDSEFLYKGFKVMNGEDWYIVNLERSDYPVGEIIDELDKVEYPSKEDVKRYIDSYILGNW